MSDGPKANLRTPWAAPSDFDTERKSAAKDTIESLRAENARLREALEKIMRSDTSRIPPGNEEVDGVYAAIARAALSERSVR